jgi:hypothetical protein
LLICYQIVPCTIYLIPHNGDIYATKENYQSQTIVINTLINVCLTFTCVYYNNQHKNQHTELFQHHKKKSTDVDTLPKYKLISFNLPTLYLIYKITISNISFKHIELRQCANFCLDNQTHLKRNVYCVASSHYPFFFLMFQVIFPLSKTSLSHFIF